MKKVIELEINDKAITFNITLAAYNQYINSTTPNNKIQPAHNFCMNTVDDSSKAALRELIKQPGMPLHVAGAIVEEYQPDIAITVKKSKGEQETSAKTA